MDRPVTYATDHLRYNVPESEAPPPIRRRMNAMTYARNTTVTAIRTRNEIEETLERYGADGFEYAAQGNLATVIFAMENRRIRFVLKLPDPEDFRHTNHSPPRERGQRAQQERLTIRPVASGGAPCCWSSKPSWKRSPPASPPSRPSSWPTSSCLTTPPPGSGCCPQIDRAYRTGEMPHLLPAAGNDASKSTGPIPLTPA